uniref:neurogenic locus notch homolog protein 1-like isoform X1 n=1 Tax=Styela clava TaxID=7725 RepID=UPI001939ADF1|nr:neurogenic locus notch homolog protein 1-like isoform X1 [Styela clava]
MKEIHLAVLCLILIGAFSTTGANQCKPNPCRNKGRCKSKGGMFSCTCVGPWEGSTCRLPGRAPGPCDANPCKNGGECFEKDTRGYFCNCMVGYHGLNCQKVFDVCKPNPCGNSGTCSPKLNGYTCKCKAGYGGSTCRLPIRQRDDCNPNPCKNGKCRSLGEGSVRYICDCFKGYSGLNCQTGRAVFPGGSTSLGANCLNIKSKEVKSPVGNTKWINNFMNKLISDVKPIWKTFPGFLRAEFGAEAQIRPKGMVQATITAKIWLDSAVHVKDLIQHYIQSSKPLSKFSGIPTVCGSKTIKGPQNPCKPNPCKNGGTCTGGAGQGGYRCGCVGGFSGKNCLTKTDFCRPNPCLNGGDCVSRIGGYICICSGGYGGENCRTELNPCRPNPCQNRGQCARKGMGYVCNCKGGYGGQTCRLPPQPTSPCDKKPCKFGGRCISPNGKGYVCECKAGYTGKNCHIEPSPCRPNPCRNQGKCSQIGTGFVCKCRGGFVGSTCRLPPEPRSPCDKKPCKYGGRCISPDGKGYVCECKPGYAGNNCQIGANHCKPNPCGNGGDCIPKVGGYVCICRGGYGGENCQTSPNRCRTNPCGNGGDCVPKVGGYVCICKGGYGGENCQIGPNYCRQNPCGNGGDCIPKVGGYVCICKGGYGGENCQIGPNYCRQNPCGNGGDCIPKVGGYVCICKGGYGGENCQIGPNYCRQNPCGNGGDCIPKVGGYVCICKGGYGGEDCQIPPRPIGHCAINPCLNGGRCRSPDAKGYVCDCLPGYSGVNCGQFMYGSQTAVFCIEIQSTEMKRNEGNPNWLNNMMGKWKVDLDLIWESYPGFLRAGIAVSSKGKPNGMVQSTIRSTVWVLLPKLGSSRTSLIEHFEQSGMKKNTFVGSPKFCDSEFSLCKPQICGIGRRCVQGYGGFVCLCTGGYSGENCEIVPGHIDHCSPSPCQHGGSCRSVDAKGYQCNCVNGYTGINCQKIGQQTAGKYCIQIQSTDAKGSLDNPNFFENFVDELKGDLSLIWKTYSGFMRAEFGVEAVTKPNSKVQATIRVTVWVSLAGRDRGVTVQDLIRHFVQSNARKGNFIGKPQPCLQ